MPQPGEKPLNFIRSIPANRSRNVSPFISTITLFFDKNVVDDCVWRNNQRQIQVWEGTQRLEKDRDYRVVRSFAFAQRRQIFIKPIGRLAANTDYTIAIFPGMSSKAGEKLGKTVIIKFRTGRRRIVPRPIEE